jgi:hypothetical protein
MKFIKDGSSSQFLWFCGCVFDIEMHQTIFAIPWIIQNVGFRMYGCVLTYVVTIFPKIDSLMTLFQSMFVWK